ncbi:peptidyl-prolyl cis-trans isomerase FKBP13, chloroplastic [Quercus robur]|uniref:peptidylprolyl isomerase n=1 Tax=Quercus lobata TaxID=97700 RepID=A0A7N2MV69_QUELO|nr:peptidyl-prolyl cis-trans isomerase FKBP13, chloroplastic [Quercus lobata]XP_050262157.1 peptidyl-prolyl cis-trans isomerase FKBP13, chloroplastic [Quercus robur]
MSSLTSSIGTVNPRKFRIPNKRLIKNSDSKEASNIRFSSQSPRKSSLPIVQKNVNPITLLSRREALGFSFCFGFLDVLLQPEESVAAEAAPCELTVAPSGLAFCDKVVGTGPEAAKGQLIKAHYVGKLENGKVFDSSYNRGKPLTFRIGVGEVIKGWDQGILGGDGIPPMLAGGKRILKLPPELGYGVRGAGCKGGSCIIPPDSVLLFDVEFVGKA